MFYYYKNNKCFKKSTILQEVIFDFVIVMEDPNVDLPIFLNKKCCQLGTDFIYIPFNEASRIPQHISSFKKLYEFIRTRLTFNVINSKLKNIKKDICFHAITNVMGMPNRGPIIQTKNKQKYFKEHITNFDIHFGNCKSPSWTHTLNPHFKPVSGTNVSIGPNIDLKLGVPGQYRNKNIVADSIWMKNYLIDKFDINENQISIIPIYVTEDFYNTKLEQNEQFTLGAVGYYQNNDIKNISSLIPLCKQFPDIRFELLSSRNKNKFPSQFQNIPNLHFYNIPHEEVVSRMKTWHGYIGMSKRERGPAVLQELKVLGVPTICPLHTGYKEFGPLLGVNVQPLKSHSTYDINKYILAINTLRNNYDYYSNLALVEKERFWKEEKSVEIVSRKWEQFFEKCLGE